MPRIGHNRPNETTEDRTIAHESGRISRRCTESSAGLRLHDATSQSHAREHSIGRMTIVPIGFLRLQSKSNGRLAGSHVDTQHSFATLESHSMRRGKRAGSPSGRERTWRGDQPVHRHPRRERLR